MGVNVTKSSRRCLTLAVQLIVLRMLSTILVRKLKYFGEIGDNMTKDRIRKHFENKGYKVISCFSGVYVIHPPHGFDKVFDTLSEAHRFYFGY